MKKEKTIYRCPITLTNTAKDKMRELKLNERSFFLLEKSFHVYIEKYPQEANRDVSIALFFDNKGNRNLAKLCKGFVVVLHGVVKKDIFLVTNVTTRAAHIPLQSNWRFPIHLTFDLNAQPSEPVPLPLLSIIHEMAVAQESSMYVKKRIASWEGYLKIQERTADIPDMTTRYSRLIYNEDFTRVTIMGCQLNEKEWQSLKELSVKLKGIDQDIGKVLKVNRAASIVEVELHGYMLELARKQKLDKHPREVVFSNFATLSQVKRLRQGFKQLENGQAANSDLQRLLFEKKPPVKPVKRIAPLKFHNRLNEFQQEAVIGAMSAEDLYVIQGPPGTGKTTVISEICLQNAKAGLRTLVASQSNLAVDNALGRLLANKDIRILRVGRTESIEEEGKKFIEENVGQYWKDHTLQEVSSQVAARTKREAEIEDEWAANEKEHEKLQQELAEVEAKLQAKKAAEQQYNEIQTLLAANIKEIQAQEAEQQMVQQQLLKLQQSLRLLDEIIEKDETFLAGAPDSDEIQKEWNVIQQEIEMLRNSVALQELEDQIQEGKQKLEQISAENEKWDKAAKQTEALRVRVSTATKVDNLKWIILEQNLKRTPRVNRLLHGLEELREEKNQFDKLKTYYSKLTSAIEFVENLLADHMQMEQIKQRINQTSAIPTTSSEIDQFLEKWKGELKGKIHPQRLLPFLEGLYGRRLFIRHKGSRMKQNDVYKKMAIEGFQYLKQDIIQQIQEILAEKLMMVQKWQREFEVENTKILLLESKKQEMMATAEIIPNAKEMLKQKEEKAQQLQNIKAQNQKVKLQVETYREKREKEALQFQENEQKARVIEEQLEQLYWSRQEKEEELSSLKEILSTEPEREHEQVLRNLASTSFTRESLKQERQKLPLFQSVQGQWLSLLKEANDHDLNEIRKLYVKHANVIGTTCVASARKEFIESYPVFDVVIIDEVSKATPPELLLPMLKGKKIILVGDHHQLPPLLGNDTLEETLQEMTEESEDFEGKAELKELLKESLFERLFKNLPKSNKTMLAIQYRMHENIMETISQFYNQGGEQLYCGLDDSDSTRDHMLESPLIGRKNHLLWIDMPNEPAYFEEKMKGGKSLYNYAELKRIRSLLKELNEATREAKQAGRMEEEEKKSIGVISFYGEQVKRIDRMISQELHLPHLTIRTGTVDKFQGMEMDVILLSMVRNNDKSQGDIGFARDYRRLNVALSRAKELLVLIGSTKMFTEMPKQKETRKMYGHVLEAAKEQNGLRTLEEVSLNG